MLTILESNEQCSPFDFFQTIWLMASFDGLTTSVLYQVIWFPGYRNLLVLLLRKLLGSYT
jgi:hypothetical protein